MINIKKKKSKRRAEVLTTSRKEYKIHFMNILQQQQLEMFKNYYKTDILSTKV